MDKQKRALEIIADLSGIDAASLKREQDLVGDLGIDSPKALQLLVSLEDELSIEISDDDAARMDTVGDVLDFLAAPA